MADQAPTGLRPMNYRNQASARSIFGAFRRRLSVAERVRVQQIAEASGAEFIYKGPTAGNDTAGWFTCPNYGDASTRAYATEVRVALQSAGIVL